MTRYEGHAKLVADTGVEVTQCHFWVDDDPDSAPSYVRNGQPYGEAWVDDGSLMDLLEPDARVRFTLGDGRTVRARMNSYTGGGACAQWIGLGTVEEA